MKTWVGQCLVCETWFEWPDKQEEMPCSNDGKKSYGCFCSVCKERGLMAPGVVHFHEEQSREAG